jgi:hypothetical protein
VVENASQEVSKYSLTLLSLVCRVVYIGERGEREREREKEGERKSQE